MSAIDEWALKLTEELTFVQLKPGLVLGRNQFEVPEEGLYVPLLTDELANRIQLIDEDQVISMPAILRGILLLLGADPDFQHGETYKLLYKGFEKELKPLVYESITQFEKAGKLKEAAVLLRGYHKSDTPDQRTEMILGGFYVRNAGAIQGNEKSLESELMNEAFQLLKKWEKEYQQEVMLHYYLGTCYHWQKSYVQAEDAWKKALSLSTNKKQQKHLLNKLFQVEPLAKYEKGYQLVLQGNPQEGIELLKDLESLRNDWWNLQFFIAMGHQQLGELDEAIKYYGKVINTRGFHQQTAIELSSIFYSKGEIEKAMIWLEETLLQKPDQPDLICRMISLKTEAGHYSEAEEWIEKARQSGVDQKVLAEIEQYLRQMIPLEDD